MRWDAIVVGAGIVGLATADVLQRQGKRVVVLERDDFACGATVRNFGMVWPVGQPLGKPREIALRSRERWLSIAQEAGLWHRECGSLHLAHAEDELAVLEEFVSLAGPEAGAILNRAEAEALCPSVRMEGLVGAFHSPTELCVDPREAAHALAAHLAARGVEFRFGRPAQAVEPRRVVADGEVLEASAVYFCSGPTLNGLFAQTMQGLGLVNSRLQMLRAKRHGPELGIHLCAGLTLIHYGNFRACASLASVEARFRNELPEYIEKGIHLLVSEHADDTVTLGDSHDYGRTFRPYGEERVDDLILAYLDRFLPVADLEIIERWQGVYCKHPDKPYVFEEAMPGVWIFNGVGGAGMTMSFGIAEEEIGKHA